MTETTPETARLTADVVLFGEDGQAAAHRELAEETGIGVGTLKYVGAYADPGRDPRGRYVTFAYTARLAHLPAPAAGDDATDARWVLVDELLATDARLAFDHGRIIGDALCLVI